MNSELRRYPASSAATWGGSPAAPPAVWLFPPLPLPLDILFFWAPPGLGLGLCNIFFFLSGALRAGWVGIGLWVCSQLQSWALVGWLGVVRRNGSVEVGEARKKGGDWMACVRCPSLLALPILSLTHTRTPRDEQCRWRRRAGGAGGGGGEKGRCRRRRCGERNGAKRKRIRRSLVRALLFRLRLVSWLASRSASAQWRG